jgi:2-oxoglutarate ferredoxin oxidoreductase subunit beta
MKTNTHPEGAVLPPLNPLSAVLGFTNVSFLAQTVDWNPAHLQATLHAAWKHKGLGFVRILQRCPTYTASLFEELQKDPSRMLLLTGASAPEIPPGVAKIFPHHREHDVLDIAAAREIATDVDKVPMGILFQDPSRPCYEEFTARGLGMTARQKLDALERELDRFAV